MRIRRSRGKYRNVSSKCSSGHYHPSKLESGYCDDLKMLKNTGHIKDYEIQKKFDFIVNGQKICSHIVDFLVTNNYGVEEVHETKGLEMPVWNIKRKLFEALYPYIEYIVITK
jgi:hypothetical protein